MVKLRSLINNLPWGRLNSAPKEGDYREWQRPSYDKRRPDAGVAQLVVRLPCKQQVVGSSPIISSKCHCGVIG